MLLRLKVTPSISNLKSWALVTLKLILRTSSHKPRITKARKYLKKRTVSTETPCESRGLPNKGFIPYVTPVKIPAA